MSLLLTLAKTDQWGGQPWPRGLTGHEVPNMTEGKVMMVLRNIEYTNSDWTTNKN